MKRRSLVFIALAVVLVIAFALAVRFFPSLTDSRLTLDLMDAVSKGYVWDATITIQNKQIRSFYQSNQGPVPLTLTHLRPGRSTVSVSASDYRNVRVAVSLARGDNRLQQPIEMMGLRIPGLDHFVMVERSSPSGVEVQLRPVSGNGAAITNHPCLDLWIAASVSAETKGGALAREPLENGGARGATLFQGRVPWKWNPAPSADFRYSLSIPFGSLSDQEVPFLVIDYLVIVPNPARSSPGDIEKAMAAAPGLTDFAALCSYLERVKPRTGLRYFMSTSWNVKGPAT